ncbi:hypothetical protein [Nannocystis bainbridge]|uniref:Lipoprotein n=1 Tax=Nannocystis bainbridge TaxID=2995303 RepID=A0ABT5EBY3_9BACT|nr:hypothetical protein [Nannocystis bainbridge]MDC0722915.1 hypothetical protein [Nannocystis bainbridge]
MVRAPRWLLAFVLCAAPSLPGCKTGPGLTKVEAPAEGITLRYDLTAGQVYQGSVRRSATIRAATSATSSSQSFSFDLTLTVRGADEAHGGTAVTARFSAVQIKWSLPPSFPISVAEFNRTAGQQLQGLEVDFSVDDTGKILHMPELPEDLSAELRVVLQQALDALETAFLTVPARPLKAGDTWKDDKKRGRKGKLGRYSEGTVTSKVDGFYQTGEPPITVARLITDTDETEITTTSSGSHEVKKQSTITALFATDQRYLYSYVNEEQIFDAGNTNTFAKTEVNWSKPVSQTGGAAAPKVQDISDPCHPDYVGSEDCNEAGAPPPAGGEPPASSQPPTTSAPPPAGN